MKIAKFAALVAFTVAALGLGACATKKEPAPPPVTSSTYISK